MYSFAVVHESRILKQARPEGQYVDLLRRTLATPSWNRNYCKGRTSGCQYQTGVHRSGTHDTIRPPEYSCSVLYRLPFISGNPVTHFVFLLRVFPPEPLNRIRQMHGGLFQHPARTGIVRAMVCLQASEIQFFSISWISFSVPVKFCNTSLSVVIMIHLSHVSKQHAYLPRNGIGRPLPAIQVQS